MLAPPAVASTAATALVFFDVDTPLRSPRRMVLTTLRGIARHACCLRVHDALTALGCVLATLP